MQLWTVYDRYGNSIYMTGERWQHALEKRPWLDDLLDDVLTTIQHGRRQQDPLNSHKYKYYWPCQSLIPEFNHIVVVVLFGEKLNVRLNLLRITMLSMYGPSFCIIEGKMMNTVWYEYEQESDVLDVYFGGKRLAWTIELTPNIMISIDREQRQVISLTLMDYTELKRITEWGMPSFPLTGLADLPWVERALVIELLNASPVNHWLDVSSVQMVPDAPFAVIHLTPYAANQELLVSMA